MLVLDLSPRVLMKEKKFRSCKKNREGCKWSAPGHCPAAQVYYSADVHDLSKTRLSVDGRTAQAHHATYP